MQENGGGESAIQTAILRAQERMLAADVAATHSEQRATDTLTGSARAEAAVADMFEDLEQFSGAEEDRRVLLPYSRLGHPAAHVLRHLESLPSFCSISVIYFSCLWKSGMLLAYWHSKVALA
jgi:hypothetical protein